MTTSLDPKEIKRVIDFVNAHMFARYERNANGPDAYDCYTLTKKVQKELFGRDLPLVNLENDTLVEYCTQLRQGKSFVDWKVVDKPVHGCIVEMSHGNEPHHLGTWLNVSGGAVLHCLKGQGVCFDPILNLKASGWRRFIYDVPNESGN